MPDTRTKLLIVDDDSAVRESFAELFTKLGYSVCAAQDGFSALAELRLQYPDIILSDLNMPGMSGFELLSVVRRRFRRIHLVAMSGFFSGNGTQPGVAADAFYEKATDLSLLLKSIERLAKLGPRVPRPVDPLAPVWISGDGKDLAGRLYVTICCPECLRAFVQEFETNDSVLHSATCSHCSNLLRFAVVEPTNPAFPHVFQQKSGLAAMPGF